MSDKLREVLAGALEALASISLSENDNTAPAHEIVKSMGRRARVAAAAARAALAAPDEGRPTKEQDDADVALTLAGASLARVLALGEALQVAEKWAAQYPVDVFPGHKEAGFARHVATMIAQDIRDLLDEEPAPASPEPEGGKP